MHPARVKSGATSGYDCTTEILMKRDIVGLLKRFSRPWIIKCAGVFAALSEVRVKRRIELLSSSNVHQDVGLGSLEFRRSQIWGRATDVRNHIP